MNVRITLCPALLLIFACAPSGEPEATSESSAEGTVAVESPGNDDMDPKGKLVPLATDLKQVEAVPVTRSQVRPPNAIADIEEHRVADLPYVRRALNVVHFDTSTADTLEDTVMWIGDQPVTRSEFRRRALMYAAVNEMEKQITLILTDVERERRVAAGEDREAFTVSEEELDLKWEDALAMVRMQIEQQVNQKPELAGKLEEAVAEATEQYVNSIETSVGMDAYRDMLAIDAAFEKVFLPNATPDEVIENPVDLATAKPEEIERPSWFPESTWKALSIDETTMNLRTFLMNAVIEGTEMPSFFKPNIIGQIRDGLVKDVGVSYFFDDMSLPAEALCRVGDRVVLTDEIWPLIEGEISDTDRELILRELLKLDAMKKDLVAEGSWLDDASFEEAWEAHEAEYRGTLFPLKNIIVFRGYTSVDRYREHYRYRESFGRGTKADLDNEDVLTHFQMGGRLFFERGSAVVDISYMSIGDAPFGEASFAATNDRLAEAFAAEGGNFDAFSASHPVPTAATADQEVVRDYQRAPLRMKLAESELSIFVTGYSLADDLYYHGVPGEIFGPWPQRCRRHAWGAEANAGAWMVRVSDYTKRQELAPFEGREFELAREDYVDLNYFWWSEEALEDAIPSVRFE